MKWWRLVGYASLTLTQNKIRSLLSTLGIVFGVLALVAMLAVAEGAKRETLEQIEQLGSNNIIVRSALLSQAQEISARERLSRGLGGSDVASVQRGVPTISHVAPLKEHRTRSGAC